jgi:hypothetical protein
VDMPILQLLIIAGLSWLWFHRPAGATMRAAEPSVDVRHPVEPARSARTASIHIVFVEFDDQTLLLDCVLAEPYGAVAAGQTFTMVVRLPVAISTQLAALFERWSGDASAVQLGVELDGHGPRARFRVGDTHARLEILASSPLRGVDGRA